MVTFGHEHRSVTINKRKGDDEADSQTQSRFEKVEAVLHE